MKPKHTPIRTCVACRETDEKRDLLRIVRQPDGMLRYDPKGKLSGRGAYLCARTSCIALARKQKKLERSLKVSSVPETLFDELNAQAALNPSPETIASTLPLPTAPAEPEGADTEAPSELANLKLKLQFEEDGGSRPEERTQCSHIPTGLRPDAARTPQESEAKNA